MRRISILVSLTALASCLTGAAQAFEPQGAVFAATNGVQHNEVVMFSRSSDGQLNRVGRFATGGRGEGGVNDPLQSNYSVVVTSDRRFLLVVNAGSSDISVFRIFPECLVLVSLTPSGGGNPVGLAVSGSLVYVVNFGGNYHTAGFRLSETGKLTPIAKSKHTLSSLDSGVSAAAFSPDGSKLVVIERLTNKIDVLNVRADGSTSNPVFNDSRGQEPFGLAFTQSGVLIVTEASPAATVGSASSYRLNRDGTLTTLSASVSSFGAAPCWIATNGRFAWVTNAASGTIGAFEISTTGTLSSLGALQYQPPRENAIFPPLVPSSSFPLDLTLSADHRFLYVFYSLNAEVIAYSVQPDGALVEIEQTQFAKPQVGAEGLAAF